MNLGVAANICKSEVNQRERNSKQEKQKPIKDKKNALDKKIGWGCLNKFIKSFGPKKSLPWALVVVSIFLSIKFPAD